MKICTLKTTFNLETSRNTLVMLFFYMTVLLFCCNYSNQKGFANLCRRFVICSSKLVFYFTVDRTLPCSHSDRIFNLCDCGRSLTCVNCVVIFTL